MLISVNCILIIVCCICFGRVVIFLCCGCGYVVLIYV